MSAAGWVGVDLDGTLAVYDTWRGVEHIGAPIAPVVAAVRELLAAGVPVRIFTARCQEGYHAIRAIEQWCLRHIGERLPVTDRKDFDMAFAIDDRVFTVEANTGRFLVPLPTAATALTHWSVPNAPPVSFRK